MQVGCTGPSVFVRLALGSLILNSTKIGYNLLDKMMLPENQNLTSLDTPY